MSTSNRKPGWAKAKAEHDQRLAKVRSATLFANGQRMSSKPVAPKAAVGETTRIAHRPQSLGSFGGNGTKPVHRPEVEYRHDPEMLQRELRARSVRHNHAPAYNKGPDVYVTPEEITAQLVGGRRRS